MRKINWPIIRSVVLCMVLWIAAVSWATTFSFTMDTSTPQGSDDPAEADDRIREVKAALQERENVNHYWPLTGTEVSDADTGEHRKVLFHIPIASTPTVAADHGDLRIKDVANGSDTLAEVVYTNESEEELQLSSSGNNLANNVNLTATNSAGTGSVNLIKATTGDIPEILVGAVLSADTAPAVDAGIANKKYVDTGAWTPSTAYAGEESVTFPNGLIMKTGFVTVSANTGTVTFAVAFPTGIVSVSFGQLEAGSSDLGHIWATDFTTADIDWRAPSTGIDGFYWTAYGH